MERLRERYINLINSVDTALIRDFIKIIDWKDRLIGIKGARGVGKTTLMLQHIKKNLPLESSLYISLDDIYFSGNLLVDLADEFVKTGGKYLLIDEVHRYPNWSVEIKNIYDNYKELVVIFSGSSILKIDQSKADLSRRAVFYTMPGFSLREYINLKTNNSFEILSLEAILNDHLLISMEIVKKIKPIVLYNDYIQKGYYPFFLENEASYYYKLLEIINVVMEVDIPQSFDTSLQGIEKIKRLLYVISHSSPFKPNIQKISERIEATRNSVKTYLHYLQRAQIINLLLSDSKGISLLQKPDKIYLQNPNLMYALGSDNTNTGTLRETFFYNQLSFTENLTTSTEADFLVNDKYTFEIGGKNKTKTQISGIENAFLAVDNIHHGIGNKIPLWLFGFLY